MVANKETSVAETTPISEVMTKDPICVQGDLPVNAVAELLLHHEISGAPVVDEHGHPIGVVSKTDLLRERSWSKRTGQRVIAAEIMTPVALTLSAGAPISQAAALMSFESIHRLPIVDESGKVVGIISSIDVLRWIATREGYLLTPREIRRASVED